MSEIYEDRDALMNAVVMERYGTPDVLELRDVAKPTPKADEVLVRVHAGCICTRRVSPAVAGDTRSVRPTI